MYMYKLYLVLLIPQLVALLTCTVDPCPSIQAVVFTQLGMYRLICCPPPPPRVCDCPPPYNFGTRSWAVKLRSGHRWRCCVFHYVHVHACPDVCMECTLIPYSGKLLRVQTFAKSPLEAPQDIFTVLIFATKPCIVHYQLGC